MFISWDYSVTSLVPSVLIGLLVAGLLFFASFKVDITSLRGHLFFAGVAVLWFIASCFRDIPEARSWPSVLYA